MQATQAPLLRPLGVGDVLDRTFNVYKSKPVLFIALSALWYLVLVLVFIVLGVFVFAGALALFAGQPAPTGPQGGAPGFPQIAPALLGPAIAGVVVFAIVAVVLAILLVSAQSASLVHAGGLRYLAKEATIGESFGAGLRASLRLFVALLLVFLAIAAVWLVLVMVAVVIGVLTRDSVIPFLVGFLAFCAAIVATGYLGSSWLVAPVVVVMEKAGPIAALRRSWRLSEGNRWRIIGIQLLLLILNLVLSILIGGIFVVGAQGDTTSVTSLVIQNVVNFASTIVWAPVQWIAFTVLYYDLRVRKEAFDLQLAAEALPQS